MSSNYPPGVSGNEPHLTGEYPCANCGATLPEEADCTECGGVLAPDEKTGSSWVCEQCGHVAGDANLCPGGCREPEPQD
jgi:DNA-directed RNA polymerase subunit RPC12/RpoP